MKVPYHGSLKNMDHFCLFSYTCPYIWLVVGTPQCFTKSNATLVLVWFGREMRLLRTSEKAFFCWFLRLEKEKEKTHLSYGS